jgi:hypothetical protein
LGLTLSSFFTADLTLLDREMNYWTPTEMTEPACGPPVPSPGKTVKKIRKNNLWQHAPPHAYPNNILFGRYAHNLPK